MTVSLYSASAPVFVRMLTSLGHILDKAEADAEARKIAPEVFLNARLAPDMFALTRQIQIATDHAKGAMARLSGRENPKFDDVEASFAELRERIARTIAFVKSVAPSELAGQDGRAITLKTPRQTLDFVAEDYLLHFALPNFYFHVTTAYAIFRHLGVAVGKADYLWQG
jgi:hypothetical protein